MLTNQTPTGAPISVFLFAHQDDEYGVYELIHRAVEQGRRAVCIYMTSGVRSGADASIRDRESLAVLADMGVPADDVIFAGAKLAISDLHLHESLDVACDWLEAWLKDHAPIGEIFVTAWEGGHPDHDCLHAVTLHACARAGLPDIVHQYSLYNAHARPKPFFRVMAPLPQNGAVQLTPIPWSRRMQYLRYTLLYTSQRGTWIGLFPFMLLHYVFWGTQAVQRTSITRLADKPHQGQLYYEARQFATWPDVQFRIQALLARDRDTASAKG